MLGRHRAVLAATLVLAVGAVAGCGDEENGSMPAEDGATGTGTTGGGTTGTDTAPQATVTTPETSQPPPRGGAGPGRGPGAGGAGGSAGSAEDQQGGAGDEVPASSQAQLTGRDGRITPRLVRVPPYIAIRVELRSADGEPYRLAANGRAVVVGGQISSSSAVFDGLRPGKRLVLTGSSGPVVVEASAEPGP